MALRSVSALPFFLAAMWCVAALPAWCETVLFDFETEADLAAWHYESRDASVPVREASRVPRYATSGQYALQFASPAWKPGMGEWPAFECQPPIADWSAYDRLVYDVTNPGAAGQSVFLFISDSKHPTRNGLLRQTKLPSWSYAREVIPIAELKAKGLNPADIHVMHLFTERPPGDMAVCLDHFALLKTGEAEPVPSGAFFQALAALQSADLEALRKEMGEAKARTRQRLAPAAKPAAMPGARAWAARTRRC